MAINVYYEIKIIIVNENGEILLGRKKAKNENDFFHKPAYILPTGKEDYDESTFESAYRIVKDKTNLELVLENTKPITSVKGKSEGKQVLTVYLFSEKPLGELVNFDDEVYSWEWININVMEELEDNPDFEVSGDYIKKKVLSCETN